MKPVRFIAPAEQEFLDALHYYQFQAKGLGIDFLNKVESAACDLADNPEMWPVIHGNIRRRLIHRFPYGLLYRIDPDEIVVLAVMHLKRRPYYWVERL